MKKLLFCIFTLAAIIPTALVSTKITCPFCILDTNINEEQEFDDTATLNSIITTASKFYTQHRHTQPTKIWYFNKHTNKFHNALHEPETNQSTLKDLGFYEYFALIIIN